MSESHCFTKHDIKKWAQERIVTFLSVNIFLSKWLISLLILDLHRIQTLCWYIIRSALYTFASKKIQNFDEGEVEIILRVFFNKVISTLWKKFENLTYKKLSIFSCLKHIWKGSGWKAMSLIVSAPTYIKII